MDVFSPKTIKIKSLDQPVNLWATGDWHTGEAGCNESALKRDIKDVSQYANTVVMLMGDLGGFIAPDDKRWDPYSVAEDLSIRDLGDWGHVLVGKIVHLATPLKGKILGSLYGNHEKVYQKKSHHAVGDEIAGALGCTALGYSALFTLQFLAPDGTSELSVMATHGSGGGGLEGGKLNRLGRYMGMTDADLVLVGHMHACLSMRRNRLTQDGSTIKEAPQVGVITGTYLQSYTQSHSGYGEIAGYAPAPIGSPIIEIIPRTKRISVRWT